MKHLVVDDDVLAQEVDGEIVLLHLGTELYFGLNRVGAQIFAALREHGDPERVRADLREMYPEVDPERLDSDLDGLVAELVEKKIVHEAASPAGG